MSRRLLLVVALICGAQETAHAQIIDAPMRRAAPRAWTSLSIAWLNQNGLGDPNSSAYWDFGSGPQWRATLELPIGTSGATFGASGTTAKLPLIYTGDPLSQSSCARCDADANVSQIMAQVHLGGGTGFHQVIDLAAGFTMFSNFRKSDEGTKLGDGKTARDFSFGIGYGFGYGLSPRTQLMVVQDYGLIIHKRQAGSANNTTQQSALRLGLRVGLGGRR